jgi:hypothetical protein
MEPSLAVIIDVFSRWGIPASSVPVATAPTAKGHVASKPKPDATCPRFAVNVEANGGWLGQSSTRGRGHS